MFSSLFICPPFWHKHRARRGEVCGVKVALAGFVAGRWGLKNEGCGCSERQWSLLAGIGGFLLRCCAEVYREATKGQSAYQNSSNVQFFIYFTRPSYFDPFIRYYIYWVIFGFSPCPGLSFFKFIYFNILSVIPIPLFKYRAKYFLCMWINVYSTNFKYIFHIFI